MQKVPRNDKKAPLSTHRAGHSIQSQNICRGSRQQRFPRLRHTARRGHPSSVEMRARPPFGRSGSTCIGKTRGWSMWHSTTTIRGSTCTGKACARSSGGRLSSPSAPHPIPEYLPRIAASGVAALAPAIPHSADIRHPAKCAHGRAKMPPFGCGESTCIGKTRGWSMWHGTTTIRGSTCTGKTCARSRGDAALWPRRVHPPAGRDVRALIPRADAPHPASHIARRPPASRRGGGPSAIHTPRAPLRARPHGR